MSQIEVNGTTIHYVDEGPRDAPALLFSPSMFFDHRMFAAQAARFSDRYRTVRYDLRGQGESQRHPREKLDMDTQADDAAALIEALGLRDVTFVGNSMGGFIGLRVAARRPDLVRSAVVMGTSADVEEQADAMDELIAALQEHGMAPVLDGVLHFMMGDTTLTDPSRADTLAQVRELLASRTPEYADAAWHIAHRKGILDELKDIKIPLTVVAGTEDHTYPPHKSQQIADGVPHAKLITMEKTGHVHALENPDAVNAVLDDHLAALDAPLFVRDSGEPDLPVLLALHSLFLDGEMFRGLAAAARGRFRTIVPDFRGQGATPGDGSPEITMDKCADDVERVLDDRGIREVHVVAQSMGGDVALRLAARRPDAVVSLALLGSSAQAEPPENVEAFEPIADAVAQHGFQGEVLESVMAIMFGETARNDPDRAQEVAGWRAQIAALPPALAPAIRGVIRRPSVIGLLPTIGAPTLVVSGTEDIARPPAWADQVAMAMPHAELWRLEGIGHSPTLEAPATVIPRVLDHAEAAAQAAGAGAGAPTAPPTPA
jgi:3-oxoadipate enol-lactonase